MEDNQAKALSSDFLSEDDNRYITGLEETFLNDFDPDDDTTYLTEQDYANLQRNLVFYKEGDREATEYIIKAFHRVIRSYALFIVLHKLPYVKVEGSERMRIYPSVLSFIRLFIKKDSGETNVIKDTCEYIYSIFNKFEYGDIYNTLVLALLNMANKYKIITDPKDPKYKPNGTFHLYVKKCFHFEAFHFLKDLVKDPLLKANLLSVACEDENDYDDEINNICRSVVPVDERALLEYNIVIDMIDRENTLKNTDKLIMKEDNIDLYDNDSLNFNWINGTVCNPLFNVLTSYERELLVLSYARNQTEDTLANLYGYSRSTIGMHKRKAIKKLKKALGKVG